MTTNLFSPMSFIAVFGSEIRDQKVQFTRRSKLQEKLQPKKQHFRLELLFFLFLWGFVVFWIRNTGKYQKMFFSLNVHCM